MSKHRRDVEPDDSDLPRPHRDPNPPPDDEPDPWDNLPSAGWGSDQAPPAAPPPVPDFTDSPDLFSRTDFPHPGPGSQPMPAWVAEAAARDSQYRPEPVARFNTERVLRPLRGWVIFIASLILAPAGAALGVVVSATLLAFLDQFSWAEPIIEDFVALGLEDPILMVSVSVVQALFLWPFYWNLNLATPLVAAVVVTLAAASRFFIPYDPTDVSLIILPLVVPLVPTLIGFSFAAFVAAAWTGYGYRMPR